MILLDTHVVTWLSFEPTKVSARSRSAIGRARRADGLAISSISLWELAWLGTHERLKLTTTLEEYLHEVTSRIAVLPITSQIAITAARLPFEFSGDPCDRLIAATAMVEGISLVTKDAKMREYKQLRTIW